MDWKRAKVSTDGTHHVQEGVPLYDARFDEVQKFHDPGLAPVRSGGEAWHIDLNGKPAYKRRFHRVFGFYEERAAAKAEDGWFHILPDGIPLYGDRWAWCGNYQGGRCTVRDGAGRYVHLYLSGRPAYMGSWRYAGDYRDGIAVVQRDDGLSTHVDEKGEPIHGRWFLDLDVFHKGFARARDSEGWTHVDRAGRPAYRRRFSSVEPFYNGQARVERFDGGLEIIGEDGTSLLELREDLRSEFSSLSWDLVGFWKTETIHVATHLGLFDVLPGKTDQIARAVQVPEEKGARLLRALNELGLVRKKDGAWAVTSKGEYLKRDHPLTLKDAAGEYAGPLREYWGNLLSQLRGQRRSPSNVFRAAEQSEERRVAFHRMLESYARHDYPGCIPFIPLKKGDRVIDAGGGTGALARMLFEAHEGVEVFVLDLPGIVEGIDDEGRIHTVGHDFFKPWPIRGDLVLLARVLHDWDDPEALKVLLNTRSAMPVGGRVAILEMVLDENGPRGGLCDLHLLAVTGGRERTLSDFQTLMAKAGFRFCSVHRMGSVPSVIVGEAE